jgi:drug/metabolite transporter (DMT)-like permease
VTVGIWVPITILAALLQTLRNTAQRHLVDRVGTLGATLVRFLYGLPFAVAIALLAWSIRDVPVDAAWRLAGPKFFFWMGLGAVAQIAATALLLRAMKERNFALGVAYSKTEGIQIAAFGLVFLGDPLTWAAAAAIVAASVGVMMVSVPKDAALRQLLVGGWTTRAALYGIASGTGFALAAVGFRGAILDLTPFDFLAAATYTLAWAQLTQTVLLGGWLCLFDRAVAFAVLRAWRVSALAGFLGASASAFWFTAFALEPAAHVRTLGMVELIFSYAVSARLFREKFAPRELAGLVLLMAGLVGIILAG